MDASEVISGKKIMVYMYGKGSFHVASRKLNFTQDNPFKLLSADDANYLLTNFPEKFKVAEKQEAIKFYELDE